MDHEGYLQVFDDSVADVSFAFQSVDGCRASLSYDLKFDAL
jgi:hypothetical protein